MLGGYGVLFQNGIPRPIQKSHDVDQYALDTNYPEERGLFALWVQHQMGVSVNTDEVFSSTALPDQELRQQARELKANGKTIWEVVEETGLSKSEIGRQTKGMKETAQDRILNVLADGQAHEIGEIIEKTHIAPANFS